MKKIIDKYNGLANRERYFVIFLILSFVMVAGLELFVWSNLATFKKESSLSLVNDNRIVEINKELLSLSTLYEEKSPASMGVKKDKIRSEIKEAMANKSNLYVPSENVIAVLKEMFDKGGVSLIKMENEVSLLNDAGESKGFSDMPLIYKHIFKIKVSGSYNAILGFMKKFENINFIGIESVDFTSVEFPNNEMEIKIYILNDSKDLFKV